MILRRLHSDKRGTAAIEFTFAMPLLATLMIGILQFGLVLQASGAMRHAIGEGIRFAKVHPGATQTEVLDRTREALAGVKLSGVKQLTFQRGTSNQAEYGQITMQYELDPMIPFADIPPITLNETKTAYLPS
ncbi:MAG: pilus assembly protein [Novosphingobium sp.]|nr:pilus assembly protein [Novosphingobium sp.]